MRGGSASPSECAVVPGGDAQYRDAGVERDDADFLSPCAMRHEGARAARSRRRSAGHALAGVQCKNHAEAKSAAGERVDAQAADPDAVFPHLDAASAEVGCLGNTQDVAAFRKGRRDGCDLDGRFRRADAAADALARTSVARRATNSAGQPHRFDAILQRLCVRAEDRVRGSTEQAHRQIDPVALELRGTRVADRDGAVRRSVGRSRSARS